MRLSVTLSTIFAAICLAVAIDGFVSRGDEWRSFAWFWAFLGAVTLAYALLGLWILKRQKAAGDA
jgi:hypothetical protein